MIDSSYHMSPCYKLPHIAAKSVIFPVVLDFKLLNLPCLLKLMMWESYNSGVLCGTDKSDILHILLLSCSQV